MNATEGIYPSLQAEERGRTSHHTSQFLFFYLKWDVRWKKDLISILSCLKKSKLLEMKGRKSTQHLVALVNPDSERLVPVARKLRSFREI